VSARLRRVRAGELLALAGAGCVIASLFVASYESPSGTLDAWDTFGAAVVLLILAATAALVLFLAALTERGSTSLPVSAAVWCVPLGAIAVVAALVRLLERPDHATSLCVGPWLALAGAVLILLGAWQSVRDERTSLYEPATPPPRSTPGQ
jgi:hypothetical protein